MKRKIIIDKNKGITLNGCCLYDVFEGTKDEENILRRGAYLDLAQIEEIERDYPGKEIVNMVEERRRWNEMAELMNNI